MDNEKSFLDKITDTVKDIATLASDAASHALKSEEPPLKADETAVAYMPLAADGLVSDPMMVAPIAGPPVRKKKRVAKKRVAKKAAKKVAKKPAKKSVKKSAKKAAKKSTAKKSKKVAKKTVKNTAKKATKKKTAAKKTRKAKRGR
jgi:hypothetical protein